MVDVIQKQSGDNSSNTQIAEQNNYIGLAPEKAAEIAIKLFYDNFPRMQEEAKQLVDKKIDEFINKLVKKLGDSNFDNYEIFTDPDLQFVLYEAEKGYARSNDEDILSILIDTMEERCKTKDDSLIKITINEAINIMPKLLPKHINIITFIFFIREAFNESIKSIDDLRDFITELSYFVDALEFTRSDVLHLIQFGIAKEIHYGDDLGAILSKRYESVFSFAPIEKKGLTKFMPGSNEILVLDDNHESVEIKTYLISKIPGFEKMFLLFEQVNNINLTNIGRLIAIKNYDSKVGINLRLSNWIN